MFTYGDGVAVVTYEFKLFKCYTCVEKYGVADVTCKNMFSLCYMRVLVKSFKVCLSVLRFNIVVFNSCHYLFMGDVAGVKYNIN